MGYSLSLLKGSAKPPAHLSLVKPSPDLGKIPGAVQQWSVGPSGRIDLDGPKWAGELSSKAPAWQTGALGSIPDTK